MLVLMQLLYKAHSYTFKSGLTVQILFEALQCIISDDIRPICHQTEYAHTPQP